MIIKSLDQLNHISLNILSKISKEDCILLFGEIGVGKTTLTRLLVNNLQHQNNQNESEVLSPTFNIVYEYEIGVHKIMHYDLYRLRNEKELQNLSIFDENSVNIKIIEWAEIIKDTPQNRLEIYLSHEKKNNERGIKFKGFGKWEKFHAI
jgi:tRNA threonylcarbamoyladenosine biosynthesis protein TsaE